MRIVSFCLILALSGSAVGLESPPVFVLTWGGFGSAPGKFDYPFGLAVHEDGTVFVVDTNNHRVQRFDSDGGFLGAWGSSGSGNGKFDFPHGIALDESNQVYVADWGNNRIQKFDVDGNFILKWGTLGTGEGQLDFPWGVAVHPGGLVYVTDQDNHRVQAFDRDGSFVRMWGSYCEVAHGNCGEGNGRFFSPKDIALDDLGNVFVVDGGNNRIQKFDPQGTFLTKWGYTYLGDQQLVSPIGICVNDQGSVYVKSAPAVVKKFDGEGNLLTIWGELGTAPGQLWGPTDVGTNANGAVYVAEGANNRVSKFSTSTSDVQPPFSQETLAWLPSSNPTRGATQLRLLLPRSMPVRAQVFDARGRLVREAFTGFLPAGVQQLAWDGSDEGGRPVGSGAYYIVAQAGAARARHSIVLIR